MKKLLIFTSLLGFLILNVSAQEITLKAIPYLMHFENYASDYEIISNDHVRFSAPGQTDLFYSPDGDYVINKSPRLIFKPDSNFILSAKIHLDFKSKWDAGDLVIYNDDRHWAKFCFESDFQDQPRVVSVVCNNLADDCNSMAVNNNELYYKIVGSTKEHKFGLYYSDDGKSWFPIRIFALDKIDNVRIGFSVQSPSGKGCTADFSEIHFQGKRTFDWWKGE
jgi:regulation of enolase protein 1 (concanavalin A-like superfamily)